MTTRRSHFRARFKYGLCFLLLTHLPLSGFAFTQHAGTQAGNPVPMGHEWITRLAAIELLGGDRVLAPDPNDPRKKWPGNQGKAKNTNLSSAMQEVARIKAIGTDENTYAATYKAVWDAIIGERWVDIGGSNFTKDKVINAHNCLDLMAQEPVGIQYDHYMRRYDDVDGKGGLTAALESKARFINYFVAAATASPGPMQVWDGGGYAALVDVDRNYFLFGRALHLFEDSFSPDHTVRIDSDTYEKVRQVKSYLCAKGSEQHSHTSGLPPYEIGDVIWLPSSKWNGLDWATYRPSNIKNVALVAIEASKDAWAAFIRTMASSPANRRDVALQEAQAVAQLWLTVKNVDETINWYADEQHRDDTYVLATNQSGKGRSQEKCMQDDWHTTNSQADEVRSLEEGQRICLYNVAPVLGATGDYDPVLYLPYNWQWLTQGKEYANPPAGWKIGDTRYATVKIANRIGGNYMRQENGYVYNDPPDTPKKKQDILRFNVPLNADKTLPFTINVYGEYEKFLNRADGVYGLVGIYASNYKGNFIFERRPDGYYNIKNTYDNQYMYMDTNVNKTYVNKGDPNNPNAQWSIEGMP